MSSNNLFALTINTTMYTSALKTQHSETRKYALFTSIRVQESVRSELLRCRDIQAWKRIKPLSRSHPRIHCVVKMVYECVNHEIVFDTIEQYTYHKENECAGMLVVPNICSFVQKNGKCCKRHYKHVSSLILHYEKRHQTYACSHCLQVFTNKKDLENHTHPYGINYRESMSNQRVSSITFHPYSILDPVRCKKCPASFLSQTACLRHEINAHDNLRKPREELELNECCTLCDRRYGIRTNLIRHMRKIHGIVSERNHSKKRINLF